MSVHNSGQVVADARSRRVVAPAPLPRLATLLRLAEGAWAVATYDDRVQQRQLSNELRAAVAPVPVIERSLNHATPDPLAILQALAQKIGRTAPLVSFTGIEQVLPDIYGYLDLQRESLAGLPHRLLFWVAPHTLHELAVHAPNFMSRLSGVFNFAGNERSLLDPVVLPDEYVAREMLVH